MFGLLWRLILWVIRVIGYALGVIGIIAIALYFLVKDAKGFLTPGIIMLVVGVIAISVTHKKTDKIIAKKMCTCSKCKGSLSGAAYRYSYKRANYNNVYHTIPVDFEITCPHCGKTNFKCENVEIYDSSASNADINATIESWMDEQLQA